MIESRLALERPPTLYTSQGQADQSLSLSRTRCSILAVSILKDADPPAP